MLDSFQQKKDEVWMRTDGEDLHRWKSLADAARIHWPYACAASAAYQKGSEKHPLEGEALANFQAATQHLPAAGWVLWDTLPQLGDNSSGLAEAMTASHLRAQVWDNGSNAIIVAFGGTVGSSIEDWKANFRWFLPASRDDDEYGVLVNQFAPAFARELERRSAAQPWLSNATITSVGHSLGGGLAECFAYALNAAQGCHSVYAFDPSPVSAKHDSTDFAERAAHLTINRIYRRDEILAAVRSAAQLADPHDVRSQGQTWNDYRYMFDWKPVDVAGLPWIGVSLHAMLAFANVLYTAGSTSNHQSANLSG